MSPISGVLHFSLAEHVVAETPDLLVINKPAGLLAHPTRPNGPLTLWDFSRDLLAYEVANGGQVSIINRLDRETSGLTLIAKSPAAARDAGMAMQSGAVRKAYLAIVTGHPPQDRFRSDSPILRLGSVAPSTIWLKRAVHPEGQPASTRFEVLRRWVHPVAGPLSLIRAEPITGRTHQIRVHLAHLGYPVLGDKIYGPDEQWYLRFIETGWTTELASALYLSRHALHSTELTLPFRDARHQWSAPLPADMAGLLPGGDNPAGDSLGDPLTT